LKNSSGLKNRAKREGGDFLKNTRDRRNGAETETKIREPRRKPKLKGNPAGERWVLLTTTTVLK